MHKSPKPKPPEAIAAIATAPGRGGIGIVRISGESLAAFAHALTGKEPKPRHAGFVRFRDAAGAAIDEGLLLYFPAPHSFTGEDVVELQGHGGPVVLQLLLARCVDLGARLAEPGEFSRRAFLNGRMDLAQAESVADLIEASTAAAARSAVRSLTGAFSARINALRDALIDLRMLVEATLDFPEEEVEFLERARAGSRLEGIATQLDDILSGATRGALLRNGMRVVLVGQPNVGKSSLLNALAGDERAIVTDIAGTTRDAVRETIVLEGIPVHVIDTAGLRATDDPVERIGVARTRDEITRADVVLLLVDARGGLSDADIEINDSLPAEMRRIIVRNKIDLCGQEAGRGELQGVTAIGLSALEQTGIDLLRAELLAAAGWYASGEELVLARERHLVALRAAREYVAAAARHFTALDLFAEDLRQAQDALGEITGTFTSDDLLGVIFSRFCIGK